MTATSSFDVVIPTIGRESLLRLLEALVHGEGPPPRRVVVVDDRPFARLTELHVPPAPFPAARIAWVPGTSGAFYLRDQLAPLVAGRIAEFITDLAVPTDPRAALRLARRRCGARSRGRGTSPSPARCSARGRCPTMSSTGCSTAPTPRPAPPARTHSPRHWAAHPNRIPRPVWSPDPTGCRCSSAAPAASTRWPASSPGSSSCWPGSRWRWPAWVGGGWRTEAHPFRSRSCP